VIIVVRTGCAAPSVNIEWEVDIHYVPFTLTCVTTTLNGLPVGTQMDWLSCNNTGTPPARTRVAPVIHCAVAHVGLGTVERPQPAIEY
jgi:hypothetical protein